MTKLKQKTRITKSVPGVRRKRPRGRLASGYRSKYEERVAQDAAKRGIEVVYEPDVLCYQQRVRGSVCNGCGGKSITRTSRYTPDFKLRNGTYVESKGKFTSANRTRLEDFKLSRPDICVRLLFMRDNWLTKKHKRTYTQWAQAAGFESSVGEQIPHEWST